MASQYPSIVPRLHFSFGRTGPLNGIKRNWPELNNSFIAVWTFDSHCTAVVLHMTRFRFTLGPALLFWLDRIGAQLRKVCFAEFAINEWKIVTFLSLTNRRCIGYCCGVSFFLIGVRDSTKRMSPQRAGYWPQTMTFVERMEHCPSVVLCLTWPVISALPFIVLLSSSVISAR